MMDFMESPVVLGGIMFGVALSAWSLGRAKAGPAPARTTHGSVPLLHPDQRREAQGGALAVHGAVPTVPGAATLRDLQASAERQLAPEQAVSLCELHAEVRAYREQEQIFASLPDDMSLMDAGRRMGQHDRHSDGLAGAAGWRILETVPQGDWRASRLAAGEAAMLLEPAPQPSPDGAPFVRV